MSTSAAHYSAGVQDGSDSDSDSTTAISSTVDASAYSNAGGILNVSANTNPVDIAPFLTVDPPPPFPTPSGVETAIATARWEDTITNNTGTLVDYRYIFHVSNPRVGIAGNAGDFAALTLNISVNDVSVYSAFIHLDTSGLTYDPVLNPPGFVDANNAFFASFDASASLGTFNSGQSFTLAYDLKAYAEAGVQDEFNGVFAAVGDPAFPEGIPLEVIATPVPEPTQAILLGMGLAGIGLRRRRRDG
ncbi:PEP-CTERM sorting domain-containing protein [Haloferula sp.]|uniref:PEP-CTERM sorting domain-containing protein n=1 Tax=Haloferula sp. TaxID=2497595 RepID=UPI003C78F107